MGLTCPNRILHFINDLAYLNGRSVALMGGGTCIGKFHKVRRFQNDADACHGGGRKAGHLGTLQVTYQLAGRAFERWDYSRAVQFAYDAYQSLAMAAEELGIETPAESAALSLPPIRAIEKDVDYIRDPGP